MIEVAYCTIVVLIFVGIGISCWKSKEAVGFFTFVKPPQIPIKNTKSYNHAVSILWFVFAAFLEVISLLLLFVEQNSLISIFLVAGSLLSVIALIIAYLMVETHYKK